VDVPYNEKKGGGRIGDRDSRKGNGQWEEAGKVGGG